MEKTGIILEKTAYNKIEQGGNKVLIGRNGKQECSSDCRKEGNDWKKPGKRRVLTGI